MLQTSEIGMLLDQHLFQLTCLLSTRDIRLSSRVQVGDRELLALVRGSGDLILHYIPGNGEVPIIKRFLWFSDNNKKISALCFDPSGSWLLVAGFDGSLYIVPALSLVDPRISVDPHWPTTDVTTFASSLTKSSNSHPTSLVWWQTLLDGQHIAVLGTGHGDLIFISLSSGLQVGITFVHGSISVLHLCQDNSLDSVFLLISGSEQSQWKLLLEQRATGYSWPIDSSGSAVKVVTSNTDTNIQNNLELEFPSKGLTQLPTARSRLQGLKQLSVEKLTNLRQKLAETRSKNASSLGAVHFRRESSGSSSDDMSGSPAHHVTTGPAPEKLSAQIGETILCPQYSRNRNLLSGYYAPSSILTIHGMSLEEVPLFVHKLPPDCGDILVTDKFLFTVNTERKKVYVISCQLSESRLDGDLDYNPDSIVEAYQVETDDEKILNIYKCAGIYAAASHSSKELESKRKAHQAPFLLPKSLDEINLDAPSIDTCIIVTTKAVYEVTLRKEDEEMKDHGQVSFRVSPAKIFMDLVMNDQAIEKAEKLAVMFGLNMQQLLEYAGDLKLSAKDFPLAISLYKLSRCRHLKSVLKFAAGGYASELLKYITMLFSTSGLDLSTSERIHLSNLAVMSYTEQVLRVHFGKPSLMDNFLKLLGENLYYDEVLAVNVAGQTGLWKVLQFLASHRGLQPEVLDILTKIIRPLKENMNKSDNGIHLPALDAGLWMCVSDASLLQSLLAKPQNAKQHMDFVRTCLPHLKQFALQRLAALYDPSSPQLRPSLRRLFKVGCKRERLLSSSSSYSVYAVQPDSSDLDMGDIGVPMEDMVQLFALVLLYLVKQCQTTNYAYIPDLMEKIKITQDDDEDSEDLCPSLPLHANTLSAGFAHVALIKNGSLYTWGNTVKGCLGNGPTMSRFDCPQPLSLFPTLKLEVISVSCGHQHTLALTNNGVYAWGSSQYGQLGLGRLGQTPYPRLVEDLAKERIIAVSCGQYHSMALVDDGRLFTWGWGVHGQLGHKSIEDCRVPTLVNRMVGKVVTQICGGYAHTLVLTAEGYVYTFGSSVFGQLGNGSIAKSSVPVQVTALTERMIMISTGYFHNLAVSSSNKLYTWGASPQVLRLQAQAQKKARLLQQQQVPTSSPLPEETVPPSVLNTPEDSLNFLDNASSQESSVTSHTPAQRDMKAVQCHTHPLADIQNDDITVISKDNDSSDVTTSLKESVNVKQKSSISSKNERKPSWIKDNLKSSPVLNQVIFGKSLQESPVSQGVASSSDSDGIKSEKLISSTAILSSRSKTASESGLHLKVKPSYENKTDEVNSFPALVVSPTLEFKGLAAPLHSPPAGKEFDKNVTQANEDGQLHLSPQVVDTSLVEGAITQVSCGCHHSALLTRQGVLYMWGRNLDGQLGNGSRKEVLIPTPLSSSSQKGGASSVAEKLRLQQVSCGCEFTIAVDNSASGRVWAWGNNSQAQLGRAPVEDSKGLEGKLVMLKTSKRVIKLHGSQNSSDVPKEITAIPSPGISFKSEENPGIGLWYDQWGSSPEVCPSLCSIETPCYGPRTLHFVLQHFYGHYDSMFLLNKCLELENYQAAAKLAALDRNYHLALSYQLKALALAYLEMNKSKNKTTKSDDNAPNKCNEIEAENLDSVDTLNIKNQRKSSILADSQESQNKILTSSVKTNEKGSLRFSNISTNEKSVKGEDSCTFDSKAEIEILKKDNEVKLIIAEEKSLKSIENVVREKKKNELMHSSMTKDEEKDISLNLTAAEEGKSESHLSGHINAEKDHLAPSGLTLKLQSNISATFNEDDSCLSTPESVTSAVIQSDNEMHTFAIQGGTEQMSEGHRFITNTDSNPSPLASDEGTLSTPGGNEQGKTNFNVVPSVTNGLDTPKQDTAVNEKISHLHTKTTLTNMNEKDNELFKTPKKDGALITDLISLGLKSTSASSGSNGTSKISPDNSYIKEKYFESMKSEKGDVVLDNKAKTETPESEVTMAYDKLLNSGKTGMKDVENELKIHSDKQEKKESCDDGEKDVEHQELVAQAAIIVEYYISIMEEDSHSMMSRLLQQGIEFWLSHSLPVMHLEDLLLKHMSKFFYPLGLLLFCKDNAEETPLCMLNHLSTHFCLQLCSSLLGHIEKKKTYPEYVELLAQVMSTQTVPALNGCFTTGLAASQSPEQIMETVLERLGADKSFGQPCMKIQQEITKTCQDPESSRLEQLLAFSCGHQYNLSTFQQSVLPELELGLLQLNHPLPNTARVLRGLFSCESPNMHLACPRCVLNYLQNQKPSPV